MYACMQAWHMDVDDSPPKESMRMIKVQTVLCTKINRLSDNTAVLINEAMTCFIMHN